MKSDYSKKLEHPKWARVSAAIKEAANWKCENCGSGDRNLQVHHSVYLKGKEPWDYESDTLMCLCRDCHEERQKIEETLKVFSARARRLMSNREVLNGLHTLVRFVTDRTRQKEGN